MLPVRLVIDTNVIVSAALKPEGPQRTTFLLAITRPARLYVSRSILDEYADVLARPELKIRKGLRRQLLQLIRNRSNLVVPSRRLEVPGDPDDNRFLECADAARADYLVTGNLRHFSGILEKNQDHNVARVYWTRSAPPDHVSGRAREGGASQRDFAPTAGTNRSDLDDYLANLSVRGSALPLGSVQEGECVR